MIKIKMKRYNRIVELKLPTEHEHVMVSLWKLGLERDPAKYTLRELNAVISYHNASYHNAVFVGVDKMGKARHIHKRSTAAQGGFKGNAAGSDPVYSFHWRGKGEVLYLFEAPVDMLSFITLNKHCWKHQSYAAACGVSDRVMWQMLKDSPQIKKSVHLLR